MQSVPKCIRFEFIQNMTIKVITPPSEQISHRRKKRDLYCSAEEDVVTSRAVFEQTYLRFINSFLV